MKDNSEIKIETEQYDAAHQEKERCGRRKRVSALLAWLLAIFIIVVVIVCIVIAVRAAGKNSLKKDVESNKPNLVLDEMEESIPALDVIAESSENVQQSEPSESTQQEELPEDTVSEQIETAVEWKEGWVRYNGKVYEYNEDIMTFMILGIDNMGTVQKGTTGTDGGQSDAIFLVIVNPDKKDINILAVNRDTMTKINLYGFGEGGGNRYTTAQLAVQHGFGDGLELSCELTRTAVSELFYDLPIHGYVAINMGAIPQINDAVGGVDVTVLEDLTKIKSGWTKGSRVTLMGEDAFYYVKYRDITIFESARGRLARQKQYLEAFADQAMEATRKDITVPIKLYQELNRYMVTDISVDEVAYLVGELLDYEMADDFIHTLEGKTITGEQFEEFYPDEASKKAQMIELFYQEVEM